MTDLMIKGKGKGKWDLVPLCIRVNLEREALEIF